MGSQFINPLWTSNVAYVPPTFPVVAECGADIL